MRIPFIINPLKTSYNHHVHKRAHLQEWGLTYSKKNSIPPWKYLVGDNHLLPVSSVFLLLILIWLYGCINEVSWLCWHGIYLSKDVVTWLDVSYERSSHGKSIIMDCRVKTESIQKGIIFLFCTICSWICQFFHVLNCLYSRNEKLLAFL